MHIIQYFLNISINIDIILLIVLLCKKYENIKNIDA